MYIVPGGISKNFDEVRTSEMAGNPKPRLKCAERAQSVNGDLPLLYALCLIDGLVVDVPNAALNPDSE